MMFIGRYSFFFHLYSFTSPLDGTGAVTFSYRLTSLLCMGRMNHHCVTAFLSLSFTAGSCPIDRRRKLLNERVR